jgi:hypothetical protein
MVEALLVKMVAFILSNCPTPLQKYQDFVKTVMILGMGFGHCAAGSTKLGIAMQYIKRVEIKQNGFAFRERERDEMDLIQLILHH